VCEMESNSKSHNLLGEQCCQRCPDVLVSQMSGPKLLEHTGAHILHDPHIKDADNPCGLCLNAGSHCVFRLIKRNKVDQINMTNSRCLNLRKIQLTSAGKYSKASPCTNVPLRCPLCPKELDCVWKYNLRAHILACHPSATIDLYQHLFAFTEDEFVLMKGIYLSKRRKSKKKREGSSTAADFGKS
jgi:hypothetical protein